MPVVADGQDSAVVAEVERAQGRRGCEAGARLGEVDLSSLFVIENVDAETEALRAELERHRETLDDDQPDQGALFWSGYARH